MASGAVFAAEELEDGVEDDLLVGRYCANQGCCCTKVGSGFCLLALLSVAVLSESPAALRDSSK